MNNQINIIVQNQVFLLNRDLLTSESDNKQIKNTKDFTLPFPQWVNKNVYLLIQKYLKTKDVEFLKSYIKENQTIVKLLRTGDYLGMTKFHEKYINQVLIPNINQHNCLTLLEESHKKLKNINDSQTWYNLLNMSIIYLSNYAYDVYRMNPLRFKNLNQKIVNEVLQRVIRLERKSNFQNKHMLYQLIMETKEAQIEERTKLFQILRNNLKAKKIHSKIHAKLSWKLENIPEITQKNTKNFKYLDMNWFLKANKTQQGLLVTLNLIPFDEYQPSNLRASETQTQHSYKISNKSSEERSESQEVHRNDMFSSVGIFYSKVHWKFQEQIFQQDIKIHEILMNSNNSMQIILIDKKMQKIIGNQKVQLTIYCNAEAIYTFMLNYVFWHFDSLIFSGKHFCREQLLIMVKACKKVGNYIQAMRMTSELLSAYPGQIKNPEISQGFDFNRMTKVELEIYHTIFGKRNSPEPSFNKIKSLQLQTQNQSQNHNHNPIQKSVQLQPKTSTQSSIAILNQSNANNNGKRTISPIPITPINALNRKVNFSNSSSQLSVNSHQSSTVNTPINATDIRGFHRNGSIKDNNSSVGFQSLNNSRGEARNSSKRKIFGKATTMTGEFERKDLLMDEMMKVTDIFSYLHQDANRNPDYHKMAMVLKL